jgi:hypothetical protein
MKIRCAIQVSGMAFAALAPCSAAAQRVEVALFAGGFHPARRDRFGEDVVYCDAEPCPSSFKRSLRAGGPTVGGRVSFQLSPRSGVDAIVQTAGLTNVVTWLGGPDGLQDVRLTYFTIQPHVVLPLDSFLQLVLGGGPVLSNGKVTTRDSAAYGLMASSWQPALAVSGALRAFATPWLALEARTSASWSDPNRLDLSWGIGAAYAFVRRRE